MSASMNLRIKVGSTPVLPTYHFIEVNKMVPGSLANERF